MKTSDFAIMQYSFDSEFERKIYDNAREYLSWPIVYFLNDENSKDAYVGETTDVLKRMKSHAASEKKNKLSVASLIISKYFNKSATLDLEANLIRYIAADGKYRLQNGNLGIADHHYYQQKEVYWELFKNIWDELNKIGVAKHSLNHINNSDLFKYSPYKSLSKEQINSLRVILNCLLDKNTKISLIQGGAGTGKSILAIFLFKLLKTNLDNFNYADFEENDGELFNLVKEVKGLYGEINIALVIPMASFRKTISNVFKNIEGLSPKMVIGPSDLSKQKYDLVIVDEGHRLRRRVNLGPYFKPFDDVCTAFEMDKSTSSELDWVLRQSSNALIFYDRYQSIKPSDVLRERFVELEQQSSTRIEKLKTQFRCRGGNDYVNYIHNILYENNKVQDKIQLLEYECFLFNNIQNMVDKIHEKNNIDGLSRVVAGYAWPWISKNNKDAFDIVIEDTKLKWNSVPNDWINSTNSINEVGCIHTTQGYDLNYVGVIIGPELDYDFENNRLFVIKENYKDKAGKNTIKDENILNEFVLNIYKTILLRGIKGTYIYACNDNLKRYLMQYFSIKDKQTKKLEFKIHNEQRFNSIPFYDLKISAGDFSPMQSNTEIYYIDVDERYAQNNNFFACKVIGESMNKVIPNNSICLFEKYTGGSRNGLITLVEMSDYTDLEFGSNYTVKEYSSKKTTSEDGWQHEEINLLPKSTLPHFTTISLRDEETLNLKVIGLFVKVLYEE